MQQLKTGRPKENLRTKYKANIHHDYGSNGSLCCKQFTNTTTFGGNQMNTIFQILT